jgi:hypothetical protein
LRGRSLLTLESGSSDESGSGVCDEVAIAAAAGAADVEGGMVKTSYTRSGNRKGGRTRCPMKKSGRKPRGEFSRGYGGPGQKSPDYSASDPEGTLKDQIKIAYTR